LDYTTLKPPLISGAIFLDCEQNKRVLERIYLIRPSRHAAKTLSAHHLSPYNQRALENSGPRALNHARLKPGEPANLFAMHNFGGSI
jgi:hypothetical protein